MALFARLTASDSTKISVHAFSASLREWSRGAIARQNVIDAFALVGSDVTELDAIATTYQGLPDDGAKGRYLVKIHDVFLLCEAGLYGQAKAKSELGF